MARRLVAFDLKDGRTVAVPYGLVLSLGGRREMTEAGTFIVPQPPVSTADIIGAVFVDDESDAGVAA